MMNQKQYLRSSLFATIFSVLIALSFRGYAIENVYMPETSVIKVEDTDAFIQDMIERLTLQLDSETFTISSTTLIGFTAAATPGFDLGFDSFRLDTTFSIFSVLETGEQLAIQGREIFDPTIVIDLGFATDVVASELYTLSIDSIDGLGLESVNIILIDHLLNTRTILNQKNYSFTETETIQLDRFQIIFEIPPAPGGVTSDLSYWLKANAGVTETSGNVSSWDNQVFESTTSITQGTSTARPSVTENALNFNPAISFDGSNDFLTTSDGWDSNTQIIVFNPTQIVNSSLSLEIPLAYDLPGNALADAGIGIGNLPGTLPCSNTYFFNSGDNDVTSPEYIACLDDASFSSPDPFLATVRQNIAGTFSEHRLWGGDESPTISNPSEYGIHADRPFSVGRRHNGGFQYEGDVLEVISYSARISGTDLNKIESYLAIKYGITLDQTIAQDYLNSEGISIYDADDVLDDFDQNISGIGRDDISGLNQKQSQSIHSGSLITIGNGSIETDNIANPNDFSEDLSYMLWGNNAGMTTFETPITVLCGMLNRMQRIWAIQETGTIGNVTIRIPQSSFTANIPVLLISDDLTFDDTDTLMTLTDDGNGNYETIIDFVNGSYFTFGELDGHITEFDGLGATGWTNGVPTTSSIVTISADYDTAVQNANINACEVTITNSAMVTIRDSDFMNATGNIIVNGTLIVENSGSIVQLDDNALTINNGTIQIQKTTPLLHPRDFIVLSSPMSEEMRSGVYGDADRVFLIDASEFEPDASTIGSETGVTFLDVDGNYFSPATNLNPGEGYLVFPQAVTAVGDVNFAHTYTQGTLNNGMISFPLVYNGPATTNNFNLMGNPYPSAINVNTLIDQNVVINEVYYWEHITLPNEMLPGFNTLNFSMDDVSLRNLLGGIASANGGTAPREFMASGQGFGILADQTSDGTPLIFNNAMRVTDNNGTVRSAAFDINRLWLRVDSESFSIQNINLIGFTSEATSFYDEGYDSDRLDTTISLFSILESGEFLSIQGREAFDSSMEIAMGFATEITESEQYTISIDQLEGIGLEIVGVYLIDNVLGTITNLKDNPYSFTATAGTQSNRFTIVFEDRLLDIEDVSSLESGIRLFPNPTRDQITLFYSGDEQRLSNATIVDVSGKVLSTIDLSAFDGSRLIDTTALATGVYFIRIQSENSTIVRRLLIN